MAAGDPTSGRCWIEERFKGRGRGQLQVRPGQVEFPRLDHFAELKRLVPVLILCGAASAAGGLLQMAGGQRLYLMRSSRLAIGPPRQRSARLRPGGAGQDLRDRRGGAVHIVLSEGGVDKKHEAGFPQFPCDG